MDVGQKVKNNEGRTGTIVKILQLPFSSVETLSPGVDMKEPDSVIPIYEVEFEDGTRKSYPEDDLSPLDE